MTLEQEFCDKVTLNTGVDCKHHEGDVYFLAKDGKTCAFKISKLQPFHLVMDRIIKPAVTALAQALQ